MPVYQFRCQRCGKTLEHFSAIEDLPQLEQRVQCCNQRMEYDWSHSGRHIPFRAFTTKHVTGKPMEIDSLAKLRQVEHQHGVNFPAYGGTMMPDVDMPIPESAWEDEHGKVHRG